MRCIIPCAGFGTRLGMAPNQSKEMIIDPYTMAPVIEYSLDLCLEYNMKPLVVTRKEKTDLLEYCEQKNVSTFIIDPVGEWPMTVLASQPFWEDDNMLMLPDTRFSPTHIIGLIQNDLKLGVASSLGLHRVQDADKWCIVKGYTLFEKPKNLNGSHYAFGLIGFKDREGYYIFSSLEINKVAYLADASFQYLDTFVDITRDKKYLKLE